jgi:hypothetical protein
MDNLCVTLGSRAALAALAIALCGLAGCGPGGLKTYPVSGKVVFKDKGGEIKHLRGSYLRLELLSDPQVTAASDIEDDGSFVLGSVIDGRPYPGLREGTYRARITPANPGDKRVIHPRYENFHTSNLQFTITPGPNTLTVEVERAGR